jgi:two-component system response regulator AtoC
MDERSTAMNARPVAVPGEEFGHEYLADYAPLLSGSPQMRAIRHSIESIADTDATVLVRGESGVGKEVIARAVHAASKRRDGAFVKVNCAALPAGLLESELFGHEKGAFTGAYRRKLGQFEYAHMGTIYLDEVGEIPAALQAKLLHVLQDFRFSRVGGREVITVDARVIAATNRNLEQAMTRADFREDLYYRLNVVEINVPPLRQRREEIPDLAARFLQRFNEQYRRDKELTPDIVERLLAHSWPGNVRELENVIRRLVVLSDPEQAIESIGARRAPAVAAAAVLRSRADGLAISEGLREIARRGAREAEQKALAEVLQLVGWNRSEAARILKVSYKTLLNKITECGLVPPSRNSL